MDAQSFQTEWGGKTLTIETGKIAQQAGGSCTVRYGDTVILAAATMSSDPREGISFFPLSVEYEERLYAAGKIKSSRFMKREGRPNDEAFMTARMIDRAIRPLFPKGMHHDVQVIITVLSADLENDSDMLGLIGASCALTMSDIPWNGPIGGIRVGRVGGEWVINPTFEAQDKGDLNVIVAGTTERAIMIEAYAKEMTEDDAYDAITFGQKHIKEPMGLINELVAVVGKKKVDAVLLTGEDQDEEVKAEKEELVAKAREFVGSRIEEVFFGAPKASKAERRAAKDKLKSELDEHLKGQQIGKDKRKVALEAVGSIVESAVTDAILTSDRRVDGRSLTEIRGLTSEVGFLPRVHGSALFSRGETQMLSVVTLGGPGDAQIQDGMDLVSKKRYMHHYTFAPYSVGETGRVGFTGRREIGHGGLAERALMPVLPEEKDFPYVIRIVSETLSSNGSSSQGAICGSTLALMDAGVPIKKPVAGIAIGLASNDDMSRWKVLTDIQDLEDGKGGMDFKIGGTRDGITTIQLDTKTNGLSPEIIRQALDQGKVARIEILDSMAKAIAEPRAELSEHAPRIVSFMISPDRIRDVIGAGGKTINEIIDSTGVSINIENDGSVTICSANKAQLDKAVDWVKSLTEEAEVGKVYQGEVVRIMDFGAFVQFLPGQDGMVHISELAPWRVNKVTDIVNIGDKVPVKVTQRDELGRINLSLKEAKKALGEEQIKPEGYDGGGFGGGGGRPSHRDGGERPPRRDGGRPPRRN